MDLQNWNENWQDEEADVNTLATGEGIRERDQAADNFVDAMHEYLQFGSVAEMLRIISLNL